MHQDERAGLLLAAGGFSLLALGDAVIKSMAGEWPPVAVAALRFSLGTVLLGSILLLREGRVGFAMPRPGLQWLRGLGMAVTTTCFFSALFLMPLADVTAIFFMTPMITAVLGAWILGESAGGKTWLAILVGFAGVSVILRPNVAEFGWAALLPLIAACGFSVVVICNRIVAGTASGIAMQFFVAATGAVFLIGETFFANYFAIGGMQLAWPSDSVLLRCAIVACSASVGHWLVYAATVRARPATIAPMTYCELLIAIVTGSLIFDEMPDEWTFLGAAIIVAAGLLLWRAGSARAVTESEVP